MSKPMAAGVALRPMRLADLDAVLNLERELFPEDAWSREMFRGELAGVADNRHYVVAVDDAGRLLGYAGLRAVGAEGDVQTLAVRRDRWGTGLGAALLAALLDAAAVAGCDEVFLEVRADNERAQRLYRGFGFQRVRLRRGYYQPSGADAVVMRLRGVRRREEAGG